MAQRTYANFGTMDKVYGQIGNIVADMKMLIGDFKETSEKLAGTWTGDSRDEFVRAYPEIEQIWEKYAASMNEIAENVKQQRDIEYRKMMEMQSVLNSGVNR